MRKRGKVDCSNQGKLKFRNLRGGNKANSRITALDFKRTIFGLFRDLLIGIPWEVVMENREFRRTS